MPSIKEKIAKIDALAKEDEQFRNDLKALVEAKDVDGVLALVNSRGCELTAEDFPLRPDDIQELDDAELDAVAGGYDIDDAEKQAEEVYGGAGGCWYFGVVVCAAAIGVAFWMP